MGIDIVDSLRDKAVSINRRLKKSQKELKRLNAYLREKGINIYAEIGKSNKVEFHALNIWQYGFDISDDIEIVLDAISFGGVN